MSECCCGEGSRAGIGCQCAIISTSDLIAEIPAYRISKMLRFDWNESSESFCPSGFRGSYVLAMRDRRQRPETRTAERPPFGKTGALPTGIITGGPRIL